MSAAVPLNTQIQLERGSQCAGSSKGSRGAPSPETVDRIWTILGAELADEETPLTFDASPTVTTVACIVAEIERHLVEALMIEGIALRYGFFYGSGIWFNPDGNVAQRVLLQQSPIVGNREGVWSGYRLRIQQLPQLQHQSRAILVFI
ncbi:MAG TPA: hypothetical protein V6D09_19015 [Leptolyngbyaceae cyanobacterium]